ncbi:MAG TPA: hypothetical protein VMZ28_25480 [Kofleriaceae bacterium]|nr:hypothetical protein [Kofleriaceae bacterium]
MKVALTTMLVLAFGCKQAEKKEPQQTPEPAPEVTDDPTGIIEPIAPPPRPVSVTDQHMALVDRVAEVATAAAKVVRAHTGDCDASAAALAAITARSAADVKAAEAELAKLTGDAATYVNYRLDSERATAVEVVALLTMCKGHKGVGAAVQGMLPLLGMEGASGGALTGGGEEGWTGARPPGVTDEDVAVIDEMGAWMDEVSAAAEKAKGDCAAMAKGIGPLTAKGKALSKRAEAAHKDDGPARSPADEWLGQYTAKKVDMERFMLALGACHQDPAVEKALEGMGP